MTGKSNRTIGYLRISTDTQDLKKNRAEFLAFANEKDLGRVEFVEETASGRTTWRDRKVATVLDGLGADDILIVSELSRIGRSMLDCMEILAITAKREIRVYAIKGNWHLDETIQSKIMTMVFSLAAEIERGLISARTKEPGNYSFIKLDLFEEMLQATIVRCMERLAGKLTRQMRETHGPAICQTKQDYCHGGQSGLAQVEMRA